MSTPFMSEIKIVSFNFAPKGWALCNGQLLPINQNQALFALLGTTYGGDGRVNFALPNLQGRIPTTWASGFTLGEQGGETAHTLNISELPAHNHTPRAPPPIRPVRPAPRETSGALIRTEYTANSNTAMNPACISTPAAASRMTTCRPIWCSTSSSPCRGYSPRRTKGEELLCQTSS